MYLKLLPSLPCCKRLLNKPFVKIFKFCHSKIFISFNICTHPQISRSLNHILIGSPIDQILCVNADLSICGFSASLVRCVTLVASIGCCLSLSPDLACAYRTLVSPVLRNIKRKTLPSLARTRSILRTTIE